jgi:hypothetical protein
MSLDTDPLAGTDDRAAVLDVDLHMDVIAALTTRSQDDFVLVVLADLQAEGARRRNAADERRLADEHRTGLAHVEEGLLGLGDGPVSSMSSLTLTSVLDHFTSYQFSVRMRRKACCERSP